ncbi:LysR family transcriptional regulator [Anaerobacillus alkaliphilus]|uniref:LysR family transcriptional regulator n=1 Tax=Anaerobacillus alkaliphilus TaxID=1548597 RepID=A0A4Q0VMQ2_9BACI|nr:LysR family transcriptional regulator [Anaerobacillus alkaliphilus]RXI96621.1 LysR family transcriptional regulator [Anaerobacillus alkaliphilus]
MKIDDFKLLVTIKKVGTIRGAAKELLISQPAISQRLKQIEDHWGEAIFIRTHKSMIVTPVGEKIIRFAEDMISGEKQLFDEISKVSKTVNGRLSLGVSSVVGQYLLPKILETYITNFPDVKIELVTGLSQSIRKTASDFHLSIVRGEKMKGLKCVELFSDRLFLVNKKTSNSKERILIEFQSDHSLHSMVDEWFLQHPDQNPTRKIKVDQIETCKQLMAHGIGQAILPEIAIKDLNDELYTFQPLELNKQFLTRPTWLCYSEVAEELPQVEAFLALMKKELLQGKKLP